MPQSNLPSPSYSRYVRKKNLLLFPVEQVSFTCSTRARKSRPGKRSIFRKLSLKSALSHFVSPRQNSPITFLPPEVPLARSFSAEAWGGKGDLWRTSVIIRSLVDSASTLNASSSRCRKRLLRALWVTTSNHGSRKFLSENSRSNQRGSEFLSLNTL